MYSNSDSKFGETPISSPICKWALPLLARTSSDFFPSGTAIIIGTWIAITAQHVILDLMKRFGTKEVAPNRFEHAFSLQAAQILNDGEMGVLWNVSGIWRSPHTDIAFLFLEPTVPESLAFPWKKLLMDLHPLRIGSRIVAFGYPKPEISVDTVSGNRHIRWDLSPSTSFGVVTQVFKERRDSSFLNFPCYQTNARFEPSMSGGPVFTEEGHLCGLVCSGFDFSNVEEVETISYVTALWPSMATPIDANRKGFAPGLSYPIFELARDGFIAATGWENIVVDEHPIIGTSRVTYKG